MRFRKLKINEIPTGFEHELRLTDINNVDVDFYCKGDIVATKTKGKIKHYRVI